MRWTSRSLISLALASPLFVVLAATPAHALRCDDWVGLDANGRGAALEAAVDDILNSGKARRFTSINRSRIYECLVGRQRSIAIDFDDACSQGLSASMSALDDVLMDYVRSCVN